MVHKAQKVRWYENKQNVALVLGFISTMITFLNFLVDIE
jgi:hypothetical protein